MGHVMALLLEESLGIRAKVGFEGHEANLEALLRGDIQLYSDYTGTALRRYLKLPPVEPDRVYQVVKDESRARWGIVWLPPFGFNNTYGLILKKRKAATLGVNKISDLSSCAPALTLGAVQDFIDGSPTLTFAPEGYVGFVRAYGFRFAKIVPLEPRYGQTFSAVNDEQVDVIADFVVNPRIYAFDLVVLEDDRSFFSPYHSAPVVRGDFLDEQPEAEGVLGKLAGSISNETMACLNYEVEFKERDPADVAAQLQRDLHLVPSLGSGHLASGPRTGQTEGCRHGA